MSKKRLIIISAILVALLLTVAVAQNVVKHQRASYAAAMLPFGHRAVEFLTDYLDLTDQQQSQIKSILTEERSKMQPLLAVTDGRPWLASDADVAPLVQDALDEIEYISGDKSTPWRECAHRWCFRGAATRSWWGGASRWRLRRAVARLWRGAARIHGRAGGSRWRVRGA